MSYLPHTLISFGGGLAFADSQDEIWQCGIRVLRASANQPLLDPGAYLDEIAGPLGNWFSTPANHMANASNLAWCKVNNITAAGHYADANTNQHLYSPPIAGQGGGQQAPAFCSIVFSFRADVVRGRATHGRIYPPNFTFQPLGSRISNADMLTARTSAVNLLKLIENVGGSQPASPYIFSRLNAEARPITRVGIGSIYDFISRRKNAAPEAYTFTNAF